MSIMRRYKKFTALILCMIFFMGVLGGCSSSSKDNKESKSNIVVTDALDRKVEIKGTPQKIASSYYISTALLVSLGVQDKLVAVEGKAKTRELYKMAAKNILDLPSIGNAKNINVEEIAKLKADLVIIPTRLKNFIPKLEKLNIPVIAIEPETLDGFINTVNVISKAVGKEERGKELVDYYNKTIDKVKDLTKNIKDKKSVYLSGTSNVLRTCTGKMYQNYLINTCGGINVTSNLKDGYWANISVEELIKYNPDKIYIVEYAKYSKDDVLKDKRLQGIKAIKNKQVYVFPSKIEPWDYPTPSSALGMLWTVNNLYPEVYSSKDYEKAAKDFYKKFYGIEVNKEDIGL